MNVKKHLTPIMVAAAIIGILGYWGIAKSGYFIDEIYTYCASNGIYPPFIGSNVSLIGDSNAERVITSDELYDLVSARDDKFDLKTVYLNHSRDLHPPLYGFLLHTSSSVFESVGMHDIKWQGLFLNYILYALTLFILYKLCLKLFSGKVIALSAVILYGLSRLGLSTALMVRMYILLTLLTVLLAYCIVCIMQSEKWYLYPLVTLIIFGGMFTQYFFVYYAFFVCAAYDIYALAKRKYKSMLMFSVCALIGVACLFIAYPACLNPFMTGSDVSAQSVFGNLLSPANYGIKLIRYTASAARYIIGGASAGFLAAIFLFINGIKHKKLKIILCKEECIQSLVIIIPAFLALIVIGAGNVSESLRYIYNLGPLFILTMALMLWLNKCVTPPRFTNAHPKQEIYLLLLFGLAVIPMIKYDPDYVYPEHKEYNEILENYKDMPCVCMNNNSNVLLTADLFQLMKFDKIFVSNDTDSEKMKEYIDTFRNPEKLIVYIDLYSVWPDGYDSEQILKELIKNTAYTSYAKVYESFYSETYVLSK